MVGLIAERGAWAAVAGRAEAVGAGDSGRRRACRRRRDPGERPVHEAAARRVGVAHHEHELAGSVGDAPPAQRDLEVLAVAAVLLRDRAVRLERRSHET